MKTMKMKILPIMTIVCLLLYFFNLIFLSDTKLYYLIPNAIIFVLNFLEIIERKKENYGIYSPNLQRTLIKYIPIAYSVAIIVFSIVYILSDLRGMDKMFSTFSLINLVLLLVSRFLYRKIATAAETITK